MSDPIQADLLAWTKHADRRRGGAAIDALAREWRPRVARFLQSPGADEVEEVLAEALSTLCVPAPGQLPRALAPEGAALPAAWRRQVLLRFLIDRSRKRGRRRHAEQGLAAGLAPATEAQIWQSRRGDRARPEMTMPAPSEAAVDRGSAETAELALMRHDVAGVLPQLAPRRRVILWLALGGDPSPFAVALAAELGEDPADVLARIQLAMRSPHDGGHEQLSAAMIRVVWPDGPAAQARESARKALERAIADAREKLGVRP